MKMDRKKVRKKKLLVFLLSAIFCMPYVSFAAENDIKVYFNSLKATEFENAPYKKDDVIYLPLRELCEKVEYKITYSYPYSCVEVENDSFNALLKISTTDCYFDNEFIDMDFSIKHYPEVINDKMYVPSDFLVHLGLKAEIYDNGNKLFINQSIRENEEINLNYDFELNILNNLSKEENSVISPDSLKTVLAMAANGAEGETRNQILNALGIDDLEAYNSQQKEKISSNQWDYNSASYKTANSIWVKGNNNILNDDYKEMIKDKYNGLISAVGQNPKSINNWVEENTGGRIDKVIDNTDFDVLLLNTADFIGSWKYLFDERSTESGIFNNADGSKATVDYMGRRFFKREDFKYYAEDGVKAVALTYGSYVNTEVRENEDTPYEMVFVLANKELNNDVLNRIFNRGEDAEVFVQIPKFYIENEIEAVDMLKSMGIEDMFNPKKADFSYMLENQPYYVENVINQPYYVENVIQNAIIGVDENGTVASASSEILLYAGGGEAPQLEFIADRPFYYFIRNSETGDILFEGMVNTLK